MGKLFYFPKECLTVDLLDSKQRIFRFDNGFGASVMKPIVGRMTLAVIRFEKSDDYLVVKAPFMDDYVEEDLTEAGVQELLRKIEKL